VVGSFARLPELFDALKAGTYPPGGRPFHDGEATDDEPEKPAAPIVPDDEASEIEPTRAEAEPDAVHA
jgi:hypothetical protein